MNILHVIPYFYPAIQFGGTPEAVLSLARAQSNIGNQVTILTTDAGLVDSNHLDKLGNFDESSSIIRGKTQNNGLNIIYVKNRFPYLANKMKLFSAHFSHHDVIMSLPNNLDVIHFHEVNIHGYKPLALWALQQKIPVVVSTHGSYKPPTHDCVKQLIHQVLDPCWQWKWFSRCSAYFTTSRYEMEQLLNHGIPKSSIHHLPFGQPDFADQTDHLPFPFEKNASIPTLLVLGRIAKQKGIELAFRAFELMWQDGKQARLVFCGPDEGGVSLVQKWSQKSQIPILSDQGVQEKPAIYVCKSIERKHLSTLFANVEITICPSPYESFGLTLIESLQSGTPVVATKQYGCLDFLPDPTPGLRCISSPSPNMMKEAILDTLERAKTTPISIQLPLPTWEEITKQINGIYSKLI